MRFFLQLCDLFSLHPSVTNTPPPPPHQPTPRVDPPYLKPTDVNVPAGLDVLAEPLG